MTEEVELSNGWCYLEPIFQKDDPMNSIIIVLDRRPNFRRKSGHLTGRWVSMHGKMAFYHTHKNSDKRFWPREDMRCYSCGNLPSEGDLFLARAAAVEEGCKGLYTVNEWGKPVYPEFKWGEHKWT